MEVVMKKIGILSGDQRQFYAWKCLKKKGYNAQLISNLNIQDMDVLLCGTPFIKMNEYLNCDFHSAFPIDTFTNLLKSGQFLLAGGIPSEIQSHLANLNIKFVDLLKDSNLVWQNAYLTAESLLGKIILTSDCSIRNSNVFILGFGRCGMNIAKLLEGFQCNIFVYDHTLENLSRASSFGYTPVTTSTMDSVLQKCHILINTVPKEILKPEKYEQIQKCCVLYDISSFPYGLDHDIAESNSLSFYTCPGLPGKYTSKAAGELIAETIISHLERMN